jgi:hypothetical protein
MPNSSPTPAAKTSRARWMARSSMPYLVAAVFASAQVKSKVENLARACASAVSTRDFDDLIVAAGDGSVLWQREQGSGARRGPTGLLLGAATRC